ncbi:hypothetical protein V6N13_126080 [Hibiscus sabdariffa]
MYVGNAPNPYEHPTMAESSFANPVDDNFYHPQPPIYHPSMGGSSVSNQVDDNIYHPQPPMYHPSMGGSSGANFSESYVPDIYHSQTPMYPSFSGNMDHQDITDFMAVTSISSPTFSPHNSEYVVTTPAFMRPVVDGDDDDDDDDDDDVPQRPQRVRRPPQHYHSTTSQHGQKLRRK